MTRLCSLLRVCRRASALLTVLLLPPAPLAADAVDDYLARELVARKIPGIGLAVARDGEVVRRSSYGLAHVETGSPVTADSIFAIASLDKQITAAAVLRAVELGHLGLDDPASKWVATAPAGATVRHLLSHLSGLPDETAGSFEGRSFTDYTTEQLLAHTATLSPVAAPATRFLYSDAGLLLAQVVTEKATGEPWWTFVRRELFAPAGMSSPLSMTPGLLVPQRVSAYTLDDAGNLRRDRRLDVDYGPLYSDLGMTVADFARFLAAQDRERPLSRASVATLTTPVRLLDGSAVSEAFQWSHYGLGVGIDEFAGEPVTLHSGHSGVGFVRFPQRKLSVAVFTNLEHPAGSDPVGLALGVAAIIEPALAFDRLPTNPVLNPSSVAEARAFYEAFLAGTPLLDRVEAEQRAVIWEGAGGLAVRRSRLGELQSFRALAELRLASPGRTILYRATHAHGTIYWRVTTGVFGRVVHLVWWHI